ncbi:DUF4235 domain-containing protein [Streptomyces sp. NRRL B-24720]|uniref:DUF4235 domain-containing protein n=1 Tax=Streptomyces sp. NRRL B-24720 TaxID=1476876 RepID=UPI0004C9AE76|nr:DUF4235 domain-containing protein [Streptomyces sp. NRRL B-24720]
MKVSEVAYKPVGLVLGALSGVLAGLVFRQVWKKVGHGDDAPDATDEERTWREVVLAATLQGAVFSAVKAIVDRGGATVTKRLTGTWPG